MPKRSLKSHLLALPVLIAALPALADQAQVVEASATATGSSYRFDVTIQHPDTGWDHYADGWRVTLEDGTELGFRELLHPHVNEQPFTRSLTGVSVPSGVASVFIQARDSVHGWTETRFEVVLSP